MNKNNELSSLPCGMYHFFYNYENNVSDSDNIKLYIKDENKSEHNKKNSSSSVPTQDIDNEKSSDDPNYHEVNINDNIYTSSTDTINSLGEIATSEDTSKIQPKAFNPIEQPIDSIDNPSPSPYCYGFIYHIADISSSTVLPGNNIPFSHNGLLSNISHENNSEQITILHSGIYEIYYSLYFTSGLYPQIALAINDIVETSSRSAVLTSSGQVSGNVILSLSAKDRLSITNCSPSPLALNLYPSIAGQLIIKRLGS